MIHWFSKYEYAVILAKVLLCIGCQFSKGAPTALGLRKTVQTSSYNSQQICKLFYFSSLLAIYIEMTGKTWILIMFSFCLLTSLKIPKKTTARENFTFYINLANNLFFFSTCNLSRNDGENLKFDHVFLLPFDEFKNTEKIC